MLTQDDIKLNHKIKPKQKFILSMHPYLLIQGNEDGTGGGIRLRVWGESSAAYFVDVFWGETTEIEIVA